ncbi:hypothetical protein BOTBODRAFT_31480 [Botryobasidium botryosum FD-172 SS1]|uniref:Cytochrome c oxidase subunit 6, mitochondrial n=1 Tax=Botryobasidium botryosum (strain FD-172 SS1) TaxID=930990 RepID=A0A067MLH6_BOTB1|nr:hypothetical protein BOTBODRAFT_31480 [Botryobasidium botryosum FD-172 SS1]
MRPTSSVLRAALPVLRTQPVAAARAFSTTPRARSEGAHGHETESFEAFSTRYTNFFASANDLFELQRGLNNCFAYDLVPSPAVVEEAVRAARRVNDYSTAVRIFEGLREKVENKKQYEQYLEELKGVRQELGILTKEEMYPQ